jgi:hypothetical protein
MTKEKSAPIRWSIICRSLYMVGLMKDFTKAECWRVRKMLLSKLEEGTVEQLERGLYQIKPEILARLDNLEEFDDAQQQNQAPSKRV